VTLRIAVPERGVVAAAARALLDATGYGTSPAGELVAPGLAAPPVKIFALPERDIPIYAAEGELHLALAGSLTVDEASMAVPVALDLDVGRHELALFTSDPRIDTEGDLNGARVATPLPNVVRRHLATSAIAAERVIPLDPAEHAVALGIADAVAALIDPRAEMARPLPAMRRLAGIRTGHLLVIDGRTPGDQATLRVKQQLLARLRAAGTASGTDLLQYDCPTSLVERTTELAGSTRPPEISTLSPGWSTVRLLVGRDRTEALVEELLDVGCRELITFVPRDHRSGRPEDDDASGSPTPDVLPVPRGLPPEVAAWTVARGRHAARP
jgi:ATP phosphoribosyltransferase